MVESWARSENRAPQNLNVLLALRPTLCFTLTESLPAPALAGIKHVMRVALSLRVGSRTISREGGSNRVKGQQEMAPPHLIAATYFTVSVLLYLLVAASDVDVAAMDALKRYLPLLEITIFAVYLV